VQEDMYFYPELNIFVTWEVMIGISVFYLVLVYFLRRYMEDRDAIKVPTGFLVLYNSIQVALSLYMTYGLLGDKLQQFPNVFGLNSEYTRYYEYFMFVHYCSKLLDFVDTVLILIRKNFKQLTFLHVYHHCSILVIWGILLHYNVGNGTATFGAGLNSLIHTIMYSHYLVSSLKIPNPFKQLVTISQMVQFVICLTHSIVAMIVEKTPLINYAWIQLVYQSSMLILFGNFFYNTYCGGGEKEKDEKGEKKKASR